jgi:hypothetical protein
MQHTRHPAVRTAIVTVVAGVAMLGIWAAGAWLGNHITPLGMLVALVALFAFFLAWISR